MFIVNTNQQKINIGRYEYRRADGVQIKKKPIEVTAPRRNSMMRPYYLKGLVINNCRPYPFKIEALKEEAHLNTCFKHFILCTH
ncbi:unnamed protein product, partial [Eruca vesicaria subsp. sativa]|nr:unnamed protein product [Eruca vesicaria subsp. sativa]